MPNFKTLCNKIYLNATNVSFENASSRSRRLLQGGLNKKVRYFILVWTLFIRLKTLNDSHREKLCFAQFNTIMAAWLLLTFFICSHSQLSSTNSTITFEEYRCWKNVIHQIDSKNVWLLVSVSFTAKFGLSIVLILGNCFS